MMTEASAMNGLATLLVPLWVLQLSSYPLSWLVKFAQGLPLTATLAHAEHDVAALGLVTQILAILSFLPGGVDFAGRHYENVHPDSLRQV